MAGAEGFRRRVRGDRWSIGDSTGGPLLPETPLARRRARCRLRASAGRSTRGSGAALSENPRVSGKSEPASGRAAGGVWRLHFRYQAFTVGLCLFVLAMAGVEQLGLPHSWIATAFLAATLFVYAAIGFWTRTSNELEYYVAGRNVPAIYNGMATAADWMSVASFIGTAGVLYVQGFGGLAYVIGWTGGYCLVALLLAPYMRRLSVYTVADFLGQRYGGISPRLIGALATVVVSFVYVVAQLYGVGLIASYLLGMSFEVGIFIALGGVLVCSFLGGMRSVTWTQVAQYIVLIVAYLVPLAWLSLKQPEPPALALGYGSVLAHVGERERELQTDPRELEVIGLWQARAEATRAKLADVPAAMTRDARELADEVARLRAEGAPLLQIQQAQRRLRTLPQTQQQARERYERELAQAEQHAQPLAGLAPQALPFARGDPAGDAAQRERYQSERLNFTALVFCLMLGTAAMPHVLVRYQTVSSASAARRSVAWSLFFIIVLYLAAPALAVLIKAEVFDGLVGQPLSQLPTWLRRWTRRDPEQASFEDVNGDGVLQLGELHLGSDVIVLLASEIGRLPAVVGYLVAAGGLAAALSTADGLLLAIAAVLSHDVYRGVLDPRAPAMRGIIIAKSLVLLVAVSAAMAASLRPENVVTLVAAAFSIAASALFAPLVLGIFWRGANRFGAAAGMLAGLAVCLWYLAVNLHWSRRWLGVQTPLVDTRWWGLEPTAAGVFGVAASFAGVLLVSGLTNRLLRPDRAPTDRVVDRMRRP